jgi:hypothetical protein
MHGLALLEWGVEECHGASRARATSPPDHCQPCSLHKHGRQLAPITSHLESPVQLAGRGGAIPSNCSDRALYLVLRGGSFFFLIGVIIASQGSITSLYASVSAEPSSILPPDYMNLGRRPSGEIVVSVSTWSFTFRAVSQFQIEILDPLAAASNGNLAQSLFSGSVLRGTPSFDSGSKRSFCTTLFVKTTKDEYESGQMQRARYPDPQEREAGCRKNFSSFPEIDPGDPFGMPSIFPTVEFCYQSGGYCAADRCGRRVRPGSRH